MMMMMMMMMTVMVLYVQCGWYWGQLSFDEAEARLCDLDDGSFLVRDSSDDRYILSLSFRSQSTTHHTRIEHYKGTSLLSLTATVPLLCVTRWQYISIRNHSFNF